MARIVTWNVNSIRTRLPRLEAFLKRADPDVVCLQEIKATEDQFPFKEVESFGYEALVSGQKTYNGVAILAKSGIKLADPTSKIGFQEGDLEARFMETRIKDVTIMSVYVPNGAAVGDIKFDFKLRFLEGLYKYLQAKFSDEDKVLVTGDFNIAPEDIDAFDPEGWKEQLLVSTAERDALRQILSLGYSDVFRQFDSGGGKYSWWDYRNLAFNLNRGLRIDLILASAPMAKICTSCSIDRDERRTPKNASKPSDHAPVVADFKLKFS